MPMYQEAGGFRTLMAGYGVDDPGGYDDLGFTTLLMRGGKYQVPDEDIEGWGELEVLDGYGVAAWRGRHRRARASGAIVGIPRGWTVRATTKNLARLEAKRRKHLSLARKRGGTGTRRGRVQIGRARKMARKILLLKMKIRRQLAHRRRIGRGLSRRQERLRGYLRESR